MSDWISIKDRKPEPFQTVLACWNDKKHPRVDMCFWNGDRHFDGEVWVPMEEAITHWQPLPEPPEVGKG